MTRSEIKAPLKDVAHTQSDELFDIHALLQAAISLACQMEPSEKDDLTRLLHMADCKVSRAIEAFNDYI